MDDYDYFNAIFAFEAGELDDEEIDELFQFLVDTRIILSLQGSYGRMAVDLVNAGRIVPS